ncbi:MAG TPA: response regulator [Candidatus Dormibacteraeota bacterium]|nr:response regulator [Candidatus Dormibacteraeota bacterium]
MPGTSNQVRLLLVEDVPQVAQYVRGLLNAQSVIKLLDVTNDGTKVAAQVQQLRPDVVIVDALLQGRIKGLALVEQLAAAEPRVPVIVLTVPQQPVRADPEHGIDRVLSMPFSGFELVNTVQEVYKASLDREAAGHARLVTVFAPKGGVGTTTIAYNLAVTLGQLGTKTVLVDGSLQFGDLRTLLQVPLDAPSILDLPTDRITEADLADVLWRDPSSIDILLAPRRVHEAEMVTTRDLDKILSMLRRVYSAVVVDTASYLSDVTLSFLDQADLILEVVTYDSTTIQNTVAMAGTFAAIGYAPTKVEYVVNRADSTGGIGAEDLARALGRIPEHTVVSDGQLVVRSNNQGVPFVLASPDAPVSADLVRLARSIMGGVRVPAGAGR